MWIPTIFISFWHLLLGNTSLDQNTIKKQHSLIIPLVNIPSPIDPHLGNDIDLNKVSKQVFSTLVELSPNTYPTPGLAAKWIISESSSSITFTLKEGIYFHNNIPITSEMVYLSLLRSHSKRSLNLSDIVGFPTCSVRQTCPGFKILDEQTFRLTLSHKNFLLFLRKLAGIDAAIVLDEEGHLIGSGPYQVQHISDRKIVLTRQSEIGTQEEYIKSIVLTKISPNQDIALLFKRGLIHEMNDLQYNTGHQNENPIPSSSHSYVGTYYLALNVGRPPFDTLSHRKYFRSSIEKNRFCETLTINTEPARTFMTRGLLGSTNSMPFLNHKTSTVRLEPVEKQPLTIGFADKYRNNTALVSFFKDFSKRSIFSVRLIFLPFKDLLTAFKAKTLDAIFKGDGVQNYDPSTMYEGLNPNSRASLGMYNDPHLGQLVQELQYASKTSETTKLITEIEKMIYSKALVVPLCYPIVNRWYNPNLIIPTGSLDLLAWEFPYYKMKWSN